MPAAMGVLKVVDRLRTRMGIHVGCDRQVIDADSVDEADRCNPGNPRLQGKLVMIRIEIEIDEIFIVEIIDIEVANHAH